jgi:hypothetical protein
VSDLTFAHSCPSVSIDILGVYIFSYSGQVDIQIRYGQGTSGDAFVVLYATNPAGDGKNWHFQYRQSIDSYFIINDVHRHGRLFLANAGDKEPSQYWKVEMWPDGKL